tara:strand:+ start:245 stop:499 length:255 start_codon:yes stop_codon:yes gene_type:complete
MNKLQKITIEIPNGKAVSELYGTVLLRVEDDGNDILVISTKQDLVPYELRNFPHKICTYLKNFVNKNNACIDYMKEGDTKLFNE